MTPVRRATSADRDEVVATLVLAFADDPAWNFILLGKAPLFALFARALFDTRVVDGNVWVTDDCSATALWEYRTTGYEVDDPGNPVWAAYREASGEAAWDRLTVYDGALAEVSPEPPFWYLGVLGTRPDRQGRGLATAVVAPVLEMADHEHLDCWLETSKPNNLEFYERRGFTQRMPVEVPGGPPTWWMRRPPS
jgi:GNAT superfamily N-acetyltransferase